MFWAMVAIWHNFIYYKKKNENKFNEIVMATTCTKLPPKTVATKEAMQPAELFRW